MTNRLRVWRITHDLTLADIAYVTGYSEAHLSLIERGLRNPSLKARIVIARQLGARVGDLFDAIQVGDTADAA